MERHDIIDKLDDLYDIADKRNIGQNETELEYKELTADWIEELTTMKELTPKEMSNIKADGIDKPIKLIVNYSYIRAPLDRSIVYASCIVDFDSADQVSTKAIRVHIRKYYINKWIHIIRIEKLN